jgi:hypothetical protein
VAWATPQYSKGQVDKAGRTLVDAGASHRDREIALGIVNNWRSSHSFPLNTFQVTVRNRARSVNEAALVAQRLKRLPSIELKLDCFDGMRLSQMQDIGGCRTVVDTVADVDDLLKLYRAKRSKHALVKEYDYLRMPKQSGYRGVHLIYRYFSDKKATYNGLLIEVQLRSHSQHAWATAVETVGTFIGQALKSSQGEEEWLRFFALMGDEFARREGLARIPGVPEGTHEVRLELCDLVSRLDILSRLRAYGRALHVLGEVEVGAGDSVYYLLQLDASDQTLRIVGYSKDELAQAELDYEELERATAENAALDVVLVRADSLTSLRRAYPNYFLDTTEFLEAVDEAIA